MKHMSFGDYVVCFIFIIAFFAMGGSVLKACEGNEKKTYSYKNTSDWKYSVTRTPTKTPSKSQTRTVTSTPKSYSKKYANEMPDPDDYDSFDDFMDDWDGMMPDGSDAEDYWEDW